MRVDSPTLLPKTTVDLILSPCVIRRTFVLDVFDHRIALANPRPSLGPGNILCPAILTFVTSDQPGRYGFDVRVLSLEDNYDAAGEQIPAAVVLKTSGTRKINLRAFPRVQIEGLRMLLGSEELDVMNVSAGGAHLVRKGRLEQAVKAGETVTITMMRGAETLETKASVMRHWRSRVIGGSEHVAVKFFQTIDF